MSFEDRNEKHKKYLYACGCTMTEIFSSIFAKNKNFAFSKTINLAMLILSDSKEKKIVKIGSIEKNKFQRFLSITF